MFTLFQPRHHSMLGIDINASAVKIMELSNHGEQLCIEVYDHELVPPNAFDGAVIKDSEAIAHCIQKMMVRSQCTAKHVVLAVPDSAVISKIIQINDDISTEEMEDLVAFEADKFIPYSIDEINLDFEVLGRSVKNPTMLDVLVVTSRSEHVNKRVDAVLLAGLEAKVVDIESQAIARAVQRLNGANPFINKPAINASEFLVVCGLALRTFG